MSNELIIVQRMIDKIYDAAFDHTQWIGLISFLSKAFNAESGVLKIQDNNENVSLLDITDNMVTSPSQQSWADYWHRNDLWVEKASQHWQSKIITSQDLIPETTFKQTAYYNDWLRHLDIYHAIGCVFPVYETHTGVFGFHRPKSSVPFELEDRKRFAQLLPHLLQAFRLNERFHHVSLFNSSAMEALSQAHTAILVVDLNLNVLHATKSAQTIFKTSSALDVCQGKLKVKSAALTSKIIFLVKSCVNLASRKAGNCGGVIAIPRQENMPIILSIAPLPATASINFIQQPAALIFIRDPEALDISSEKLRNLFDLTKQEALIANALTTGKSLEEIAKQFCIAISTVRTHLKKIQTKTNTKRQAELVALLLRTIGGV